MSKDFSTCTMGVGCAEAGKCYAVAQGKPDMCPSSDFSVPPDLREEFLEDALGYILRQSMRDENGYQVAGIATALKRAWYAGFKTGQAFPNKPN